MSPPGPSCPRSATTREPASRGSPTALCWNSARTGRRKIRMEYINAFWVGGAICALVQILLDRTNSCLGESWSFWCAPARCWDSWGSTSPSQSSPGRGLCPSAWLWEHSVERGEGGGRRGGIYRHFPGRLQGQRRRHLGRLIFGYLASLVFEPKMKK